MYDSTYLTMLYFKDKNKRKSNKKIKEEKIIMYNNPLNNKKYIKNKICSKQESEKEYNENSLTESEAETVITCATHGNPRYHL
uniref:Uncharacterized protein n=1 Tax=viral metagenome TaxID=1070528 RepID=A0A6C0BQU6_9ZZZZ